MQENDNITLETTSDTAGTPITLGPTINVQPDTTGEQMATPVNTAEPAQVGKVVEPPKPPKLNRHAKRAMQARSRNKETRKTMERAVVIASKLIKDVGMVKKWMATPSHSFQGNSPITMILMGNGDYVLEYLKRQLAIIKEAEAAKKELQEKPQHDEIVTDVEVKSSSEEVSVIQ